MVANVEQEKEWRERITQWRASGLSQRAFALEHGFSPETDQLLVAAFGRGAAVAGVSPCARDGGRRPWHHQSA